MRDRGPGWRWTGCIQHVARYSGEDARDVPRARESGNEGGATHHGTRTREAVASENPGFFAFLRPWPMVVLSSAIAGARAEAAVGAELAALPLLALPKISPPPLLAKLSHSWSNTFGWLLATYFVSLKSTRSALGLRSIHRLERDGLLGRVLGRGPSVDTPILPIDGAAFDRPRQPLVAQAATICGIPSKQCFGQHLLARRRAGKPPRLRIHPRRELDEATDRLRLRRIQSLQTGLRQLRLPKVQLRREPVLGIWVIFVILGSNWVSSTAEFS